MTGKWIDGRDGALAIKTFAVNEYFSAVLRAVDHQESSDWQVFAVYGGSMYQSGAKFRHSELEKAKQAGFELARKSLAETVAALKLVA